MTTRCPFSDPQDPVSRVSNIKGQGPMTLSAIAQMLHRHGFSHQVPARRAVERNQEAVSGWVKETWPHVETPRRRPGPGSASKTRQASR
ncbi:winged helix-turn-helix domain-containing protein [Streptomyces sp. NPDC057336]|uniref:helix-turn-helix domain-containing protein n=1 Tax=Streptomyces sp. NPDC057336 TaxID=3346102 RepID=UPI0036310B23